jgi:transposase
MDLKNEQWNRIEPIILLAKPIIDPRGLKERDPREVLNGILWILRTGAPWKDLPQRYLPYKTCHRRFQQWAQSGVFRRIDQELAEDLSERGGIDIREAFIDGTFVPAKKGSCCRQDKAWQMHQNHGHRRRCWYSCLRSY